jgi:hypothetical protein
MPFGPNNLQDVDCDLSQLRKIPGRPAYFINPQGDVFTIRKLRQFRDKDGYARVSTVRLRKAVHWLLALVFLKPPKPGQREVRHLDGNPRNNSLDNLAWGTRAENAADMARHGTVKGSKNANARLTESQALEISGLIDMKVRIYEIASRFKVCIGTVKAIREGRLWSHVTGRKKRKAA